jgi:hypothetical protein
MLSLKTEVNVATERNKQKLEKNLIYVGILKATVKKCRIRKTAFNGVSEPDPQGSELILLGRNWIRNPGG